MKKYTIKKPITLLEMKTIVKTLEINSLYEQDFEGCKCGEGYSNPQCGYNNNLYKTCKVACIHDIILINKPVETTNEQPKIKKLKIQNYKTNNLTKDIMENGY